MGNLMVAGVRLVVEGAEQFQANLNATRQAAHDANLDMRELNATYGKGSKDTDYLSKKSDVLTQKLENQKKNTAELIKIRDAYAAGSNVDTAQLAHLNEQIRLSEIAEADLGRQLRETNAILEEHQDITEETSTKWQRFQQGAQDFGDKIADVGERISDVGEGMTQSITKPIVSIGKTMIESAISFESAFAGVRKTVDATEEEYQELEEALFEMSERMPSAAEDLAEIMASAAQLGVKTGDLQKFTEAIVALGVATNLSNEEGATMLAQFANITGMDLQNIDRLGSVIVELGNNTATTEKDITEMGMRLSSTSHLIGMSEPQIMGLAATMASLGISAEAGGTAMSKTMQNINTAVLGGGKDLKAFAKVAGVSANEFADAWKNDPTVALTQFLKGIKEINDSGGDASNTLKTLGLSDTRMIDSLLRMANGYDTLAGNIAMANGAWEENVALTNEAATRYGTTESKMQMAQNAVKNAATQWGNVLLPIVGAVAGKVGELAVSFGNASEGTQQTVLALAGIAAAAGPVTRAIGGVVSGIGKLIPMLTSPWGLAIAGVAAVAGLAVAISNASDTTKQLDNSVKGLDISLSQETIGNIASGVQEGLNLAQKEHQIHVDVVADTLQIQTALEDALADKKITPAEKKALSEKISQNAVDVLEEAKRTVIAKKNAVRDELLALKNEDGSDLYSQKEIDAMSEAAAKPLENAAEQLESYNAQMNVLLDKIAKQGVNVSQDDLDELNRILEEIRKTKEQVMLETAYMNDDARNSLVVAKQGLGTQEDVAVAVGYVKGTLEFEVEESEKAFQETKKEIKANAVSLFEQGFEINQEAYDRRIADAEKAKNEEIQAAAEKFSEDINSLFSMDEETIGLITGAAFLASYNGNVSTEYETMLRQYEKFYQKTLEEKYLHGKSIFGTDIRYDSLVEILNGIYDWSDVVDGVLKDSGKKVSENMVKELKTRDLTKAYEFVQTMIESGVDINSLNPEQLSPSVIAAVMAHMMADDEKPFSEDLQTDFFVKGIESVAEQMAEAAEEATSNAIDMLNKEMPQKISAAEKNGTEIQEGIADALSTATVDTSNLSSGMDEMIDIIDTKGKAAYDAAVAWSNAIFGVIDGVSGADFGVPHTGAGNKTTNNINVRFGDTRVNGYSDIDRISKLLNNKVKQVTLGAGGQP